MTPNPVRDYEELKLAYAKKCAEVATLGGKSALLTGACRNLRAERDAYREVLELMTQLEPCDCGCPEGTKVAFLPVHHYYALAREVLNTWKRGESMSAHEFDDDAVCIHCGVDGAEHAHLNSVRLDHDLHPIPKCTGAREQAALAAAGRGE